MEAFSLLKYWRGGGGGGGDSVVNARATTIVAAAVAQNNAAETETDDDEPNGDDDGPFFDLEFAVPDEEEEEEEEDQKKGMGVGVGEEEDDDEDGESTSSDHDDDEEEEEEEEEAEGGNGDGDCTDEAREFKFTLSSSGSSSNNDRADPSLALSPTDDLFFKGRLVPIEPSEPNSKQIQFPVSLIKSATKFRVFMLGLKKSKPNPADKPAEGAEATANGSASCVSAAEAVAGAGATPKKEDQSNTKQGKFFTVKFKIEEVKPIVSLFTRENSKSSSNKSAQAQTQKQNGNGNEESAAAAASDEKRFSRDVMQKYLKKVKPLYIRVSKRYGEKLRFSGQLSLASVTSTTTLKGSSIKEKGQPESETESGQGSTATFLGTNGKSLKQGSLPAGLRVVRKHLAKSRSASAAVAAAPSSSSSSGRRRDDSLLQQQDGIQSAILHCKRSFNASRDSEASLLSRSVSDPSHEKM